MSESGRELRPSRSSKVPSRYREMAQSGEGDGDEDYTPGSGENPSYGAIRERRTRSSVAADLARQSTSPTKAGSSSAAAATESGDVVDVMLDYPSDHDEEEEGGGRGGKRLNYPAIPAEAPTAYHHHPQQQQQHTVERYGTQGTDLSDDLKANLRKLKNVLKLPKARRFVFCEFFYSGVDQQLFLAENEFSQLMKESFPNLKCTRLRKPEWREVRRLIGKPRRCSQIFLNEERESLEAKRQKIRTIYNGSCTSLGQDVDLPAMLPRPPVVGMKVYARVRVAKDGIYAGTVDAVIGDGYRVVFDKEEMIPPSIIKDYEVMFDQPSELLAVNYYLEMNRANLRGTAKLSPMSHLYPSPSFMTSADAAKAKGVVLGSGAPDHQQGSLQQQKKVSLGKDEKVGNFPVRMLVILVKLCKVIEYKKQLIGQLNWMNDNAEKMNLLVSNGYPHEFKLQYAQLVLDIEVINKLFKTYLAAIHGYHSTLLPHLNEPLPTDKPEILRTTCATHAFQIVKHCNSELNVKNKQVLHLITSLTSILLQLRTIGNQKKRYTAYDLSILAESLKQIRSQILPTNVAVFQDTIEVNLKEIHRMMTSK